MAFVILRSQWAFRNSIFIFWNSNTHTYTHTHAHTVLGRESSLPVHSTIVYNIWEGLRPKPGAKESGSVSGRDTRSLTFHISTCILAGNWIGSPGRIQSKHYDMEGGWPKQRCHKAHSITNIKDRNWRQKLTSVNGCNSVSRERRKVGPLHSLHCLNYWLN